MKASIVIPNWNYARFVGRAVDSALAQDWSDLEVIVVDDGSTDGSRAVIDGYGGRIRRIFKSNGGQRTACNAGFAASSGEIVVFLDSDDELAPSFLREVVSVWRPGISKVQVQMVVIDADGELTGAVMPRYGTAPTPERIRRWVLTTGAYPTPPGSGNAYARAFLERIFPLEGPESAYDSYCLAAAPLLGDVVTLARPLARYRVHGTNNGAMLQLDARKLAREVERARWRFEYKQAVARREGLSLSNEAFGKSLTVLAYRIAALRLAGDRRPMAADSISIALRDLLRASVAPQGLGPSSRIALVLWCLLVAALPVRACEPLVAWRFVSAARPPALQRMLAWSRAVGSLRRPRGA